MTRWDKQSYKSGQHALTDEELRQVIRNAPGFTEMVLLKLAVASGMRRGDIVSVRWGAIDWPNARISFYEQKKRRNRTVYLSEDMMQDLQRLHALHKEEHYLFPGGSDVKYGKGHMSDRSAYTVFNRALEASGLENRPFHALRATCIKLAQKRGWTITQCAEHVGDTVRVIEQHYMAPSDGEMRAAAKDKPII